MQSRSFLETKKGFRVVGGVKGQKQLRRKIEMSQVGVEGIKKKNVKKKKSVKELKRS